MHPSKIWWSNTLITWLNEGESAFKPCFCTQVKSKVSNDFRKVWLKIIFLCYKVFTSSLEGKSWVISSFPKCTLLFCSLPDSYLDESWKFGLSSCEKDKFKKHFRVITLPPWKIFTLFSKGNERFINNPFKLNFLPLKVRKTMRMSIFRILIELITAIFPSLHLFCYKEKKILSKIWFQFNTCRLTGSQSIGCQNWQRLHLRFHRNWQIQLSWRLPPPRTLCDWVRWNALSWDFKHPQRTDGRIGRNGKSRSLKTP